MITLMSIVVIFVTNLFYTKNKKKITVKNEMIKIRFASTISGRRVDWTKSNKINEIEV